MANARAATTAILELVESGAISGDEVLNELLGYMSEGEVARFYADCWLFDDLRADSEEEEAEEADNDESVDGCICDALLDEQCDCTKWMDAE